MTTSPLVNKSYKPTPTSQKEKNIFRPNTSLFCVQAKQLPTSQNSSHQPFIQDAHEKPLRCGKSCPSFRLASKRPAPLLTAKAKAWMANFQTTGVYQKTCLQNPIENNGKTWFLSCKYLSQQKIMKCLTIRENNFVLFDFPVVY